MSSNLPTSGRAGQMSQRRPNNLFSDLFGFDPLRSLYPAMSNTTNPFGMEITRSDNGYTIEIPVAGFRPEQIDVSIQDDTLMISGKGDRRNFTRSITLTEEIDPDNVTARVDHGMLYLTLPQRPAEQPRRIQIQTGSSSQEGSIQTVSGETTGGSSATMGSTSGSTANTGSTTGSTANSGSTSGSTPNGGSMSGSSGGDGSSAESGVTTS
jgi:HSP20 family molecular chaperone IbpA